MDNLLQLIEKGEFDDILSNDELRLKFNELIKYELVLVQGDTLRLSERGREATNLGVDEVLKQIKYRKFSEKRLLQNNFIAFRQPKNVWLIVLTFWTFFGLLFLLPSVK